MEKRRIDEIFRRSTSKLGILHDLMRFRVREILLVATVYDAYILEREGQLFEQIYGEYYQLNLSYAPRITSAYTPQDTLDALNESDFDMVIVMPGLEKNVSVELIRNIRELNSDIPIFLLLNNNNDISRFCPGDKELAEVEKIFVWNGDSSIFIAMIKYLEDKMNAEKDTEIGGVRVILLVEDSVRYYSRYLPGLYRVIMFEIQKLISGEDIDARYKILRMRARPKVLIALNYEEALKIYKKYREYLLCVISDVEYPKKGKSSRTAGLELMKYLAKEDPLLPVLLQSSDAANEQKAHSGGAAFINKNTQNLSRELQEFFHESLGFGNFTFRDASGKKLAEARYMKEFEVLLNNIPDESLHYHGSRNQFFKWFMAKGEISSAVRLKQKRVEDFTSMSEMRQFLLDIMNERWLEKKRDSIANFSEAILHEEGYLMRLANGSVGGKGRGISFIENIIEKADFGGLIKGLEIKIPRTAIIGTDEFGLFVENLGIKDIMALGDDYQRVKEAFLKGELSMSLKQRLRKFLSAVDKPLAVRSSGLFEDSLSQPFAGIYETFFLPNNHPDSDERLRQLENAIKLVFASVFSPNARAYFEAVSYDIEEEKMAVILQELVGRRYGDNFYPHISGVAQSYNYYPLASMKPEDGIGLLAVGLGKTVVEGEQVFRFSPKHPRTKLLTIEMLMDNAQRNFYALDMRKNYVNLIEGDTATLSKPDISQAEEDGALEYCASVYDSESQSMRAGLHYAGPRIVNFAHILEYKHIPLAQTLTIVLDLMKTALGTPVEIEFAVDLKDNANAFYLLQVKPLVRNAADFDITEEDIAGEELMLYTSKGMGNGMISDIKDIVYVEPELFDKMKTVQMASEVSELNKYLKKEGRPYILIGPGRWGSSDRFLGIPVDWSAISGAKVIVEAGLSDFHVDASLGSHFFHNITSMNIGYFTVPAVETGQVPAAGESFIDWKWLKKQPVHKSTKYLRLVRLETPLCVKMDGRKTIAVISKKG